MLNNPQILKKLNLLFVEDSISTCADAYSLLSGYFKSMYLAHNVDNALETLRHEHIDIIITDIQMPNVDGLRFIEQLRECNNQTSVIILSAFTDTEYLFRATNLQIDGYMTKPLNFKKLNVALENAIKRIGMVVDCIQITPDIHYDVAQKRLVVADVEVSLGRKECLLLELLIFSKNKTVSKSEIEQIIWENDEMTDSALKNLLGELRKKLQCDVIKNQPGRGWYLEI
jgi:DNA-binding response OmpR family regulator